VDLKDSFLCGYLNIQGLTEDWPSLSTFFEAELIGERYPFLTRYSCLSSIILRKWDANENIDREHWLKFPAFKSCEKVFNDGFCWQ